MKKALAVAVLFLAALPALAADSNPKVIDSRLCLGPNCSSNNSLETLVATGPQARLSVLQVRATASSTYPFLTFSQRTTNDGSNVRSFGFNIDSAGAFNVKDLVASTTPFSISSAGVTTISSAVLTAATFPSGSTLASPTLTTPTITAPAITGPVTLSGAAGAGLQGASTVKILTDAGAAVAIAKVTMASNSYIGGYIDYSFEATDGTDFQARSGHIPFSAVSKGASITCTVGTVTTAVEVVAVSSGTLAATWSCADATGGILDLKATADTSLTPSANFPRVRYRVNVTNAGTTIAAQ